MFKGWHEGLKRLTIVGMVIIPVSLLIWLKPDPGNDSYVMWAIIVLPFIFYLFIATIKWVYEGFKKDK